MMKLFLFLLFGLLMNTACNFLPDGQGKKIYVSVDGSDSASGTRDKPVKTLHRAQQLLEKVKKEHPALPVTVLIGGGTYYLDRTLVFNSKDNTGENAPVIFKNYRQEEVIVSGGQLLDLNWEKGEGEMYSAKVPENIHFDQLFINGQKQVRARYPNYDSSAAVFHGVSKSALSPARIASWENPEGGYIHALQRAHWGSLTYKILSGNEDGSLDLTGGYQINRSHAIDSNTIFVENIREELDTAHEWYYDKNKSELYYMPPRGLDLQDAKVEVAVLSQLIAFQGDTSHPVTNIHFQGITFQHTKETFMKTKEPLLRGDWNIFRGGALFLQGTKNCTFSNCTFENLGGNAVFFSNYNREDTIRHCLIRNVGASGICFVGNPSAVRSPSFHYFDYVPYNQMDTTPGPKGKDFPKACKVFDNLIYNTGQIEKQTAGVHISMSMDIAVIHNTIYHVPRAGININDGTWGGQPMKDYLSAIDAIAEQPFVDENRLGCVGASYGGYSVYMLAGIHQNRFKTFIAHDGLFDLKSWYGTTEELFFARWEIGGPYWEAHNSKAQKSYREFNPGDYVKNWNTPILVIQGGIDFRVPVGQGLQAFQAAQLKGIKSKILYFPEENHWVLRPQNALVWQREFYRWLDETL